MPKTKSPRKVPLVDDPTSDEPHTIDQLTMSSDRTRGGFRLLYRQEDGQVSGPATICYCIEHPADGYEHTVITPTQKKRKGLDWFRGDICSRSQPIDPPEAWAEAAWTAWLKGGPEAVQEVLHLLTPDGEEYAHHLRKNAFLDVPAESAHAAEGRSHG